MTTSLLFVVVSELGNTFFCLWLSATLKLLYSGLMLILNEKLSATKCPLSQFSNLICYWMEMQHAQELMVSTKDRYAQP